MKQLIALLLIFFITIPPAFSAKDCCKLFKRGIHGCVDGRIICADNTRSRCRCKTTTSYDTIRDTYWEGKREKKLPLWKKVKNKFKKKEMKDEPMIPEEKKPGIIDKTKNKLNELKPGQTQEEIDWEGEDVK